MKKAAIYLFSFMLLFLFSCKKEKATIDTDEQTIEIKTDSVKSSEIIQNWEGEYKGIFPCEDCDGIETSLTLNFDNSFVQISHYIGKGGPYESKGSFEFDEDKQQFMLSYEDGSQALYKLSEYSIILLDESENEMDEYRLSR